MSEKSLEKLRALLKGYAERAGAGAAPGAGDVKPVHPVHHESQRRRRACGDRLHTVVPAVLDRVADALNDAGHAAAIEDHSATPGPAPSAGPAVTPPSPGAT